MKKIMVITSGQDAPGMNTALMGLLKMRPRINLRFMVQLKGIKGL